VDLGGGVLVSLGTREGEISPIEQRNLLEQAMLWFPSASTCSQLGEIYVQQGLTRLALIHYQRTATLYPRSGLVHTKLANVYRSLGRLDDAEASYRRSVRVEPGYVGAYINLAGIYELQGRDQETLELLQTAVHIAPDSAWAHSALGSICLKMEASAHGNASVEALVHLERAVELEPENVTWLLSLAYGYREVGQSLEAIVTYRRVLDLDPGNQKATNALEELEP
jgi:tetratricopeptide (TPR) repeat protein